MFPQRLKEIRKASNITQESLADKIGVKRAVISKYESGMVSPSLDVLIKIANALSVPLFYLLDGEESGLSLEQAKNEHSVAGMEAAAYDGVVSILAEIYGGTESRRFGLNRTGFTYQHFGDDEQGFVLDGDDIVVLCDAIKGFLPPVVERLKRTVRETFQAEHEFTKLFIDEYTKNGRSVDDLLLLKEEIEEWLSGKNADKTEIQL